MSEPIPVCSAPMNAQHEPPYPNHETVVMSIRDPSLTAHPPSNRCAIQTPHPITECGHFHPDKILSVEQIEAIRAAYVQEIDEDFSAIDVRRLVRSHEALRARIATLEAELSGEKGSDAPDESRRNTDRDILAQPAPTAPA